MEENILTMPVIALRGLTVLPAMVIHFDISRKKSIAALEKAMMADQKLFLIGQKSPDITDPSEDDLWEMGTIAEIRQLVKMPGGLIRVMVEGKERARLLCLDSTAPMLTGRVEPELLEEDVTDPVVREAMLRILKEKVEEFCAESSRLSRDSISELLATQDLEEFMFQASTQLPWEYTVRQKFLEVSSHSHLYEVLVHHLIMEIEVAQVKKEFQGKVRSKVEKNQKDYILREQMRIIREELGEENEGDEADDYLARLSKLKMEKETREKLTKEIERFRNTPGTSQEANVLRMYIETLLELPWKKMSKDNNDIRHAEQILDEDHYGLEKVKERILEYLAVRTLAPKGNGPIICLVGPPGTGKTSVARSVARALNKQYVRISLGGVRDEAEIRGHRKTYVGAMPGRLVEGLRQAGVSNPLMLLDEIDKVSSDYKGDTSAALLEVLDGEQNMRFRDHYVETPIDLSQVLFIATANTTQTIPKPLLDRMEVIEVNSYTENEKFHIARQYLVGKQLEKNGLKPEWLSISDNALRKIIHNYTREAGVRNLERRIGDICRKAAREYLEHKELNLKVTESGLEKYLGKEKISFEDANSEDQIGIVRGLAWTSVGGDTLQIEVNVMPGKGELKMTGQMGDVMKESAQIALTYVRSVCPEYQVKEDFFEKHDIHIHIPEGAVPKDGPSAGITMAAAMISAVIGCPVDARTAMTGEITLRGRVLPIGGLKEKLLAAKMARIKKVLVPERNKPDIGELSGEITKGLKIVYVKDMSQVLKEALVNQEGKQI
ncbi:MAG: endopeptidase La [Hungatella sp.]|nr:endopeptidase La [Hungatella sp.]